jgi:wobble nucleotide-excising tRNase
LFKRINHIRDFGVYNNFTGQGLPEFAPVNLIFGWNYSGKTTLSRVFRCLEEKSLHPDYPNAKFSLETETDQPQTEAFSGVVNVRVFNEDFRNAHLKWDDSDGFNPILMLGADSIENQEELRNIEVELGKLASQRLQANEKLRQINTELSDAETQCAKQIANELPIPRFTKTNLKPLIAAWSEEIPAPLSKQEFEVAKNKVSAEQKGILPDLKVSLQDVGSLWTTCKSLLQQQVGSTETIEHLARNPSIGTWVEAGLSIHKERAHCEFCQNPLKPDRLAALNAHFSDAFNKLKVNISQAVVSLTQHQKKFPSAEYAQAAFYRDLRNKENNARRALLEAIEAFNKPIQEMLQALGDKDRNPFDVIPAPEEAPQIVLLSKAIDQYQAVISENNQRTQDFNTSREEAIELLKIHYAAEAMLNVDRPSLLADINIQEDIVARTSKDIDALQIKKEDLELRLSDAAKGAEAINAALFKFFGKNDLQVEINADDRFILKRGGKVAKNLSEGERTAIAFCYFVTKLLENGNDLSETIVYIDDPISSLDSHHLLHINAFIQDTFYEFNRDANPKHICKAKQLLISTHNYEFFHLTLDWMSKAKKDFYAVFLVERTDSNGLVCSRISQCPEAVTRYKSEYLFLYHKIADYLEEPSNDPQVIFNIGNMGRRFLEGYFSFKFMEDKNIDQSLPRLVTDTVQRERIRKFLHFYSHTLSRAGGMRLPDMSEAKEVLETLFEAVREQDPLHYAALERTRLATDQQN